MSETDFEPDGQPHETGGKLYGKYPAEVVDNQPPDDGAHRGELTVKVPGILEETPQGTGEQPLQAIARPCFQPGFFFVPDIGARVWVEFAAGDVNQPVWTGVWYPSDASPQTSDDQAPVEQQKIIRTTSGHVIQLDDTDGEEKIVIFAKGGAVVEIKSDETISITGKSVTIETDELKVTGNTTIEKDLKVTGATTIEGDLVVGTGPKTTISGNEITGGA
jgi:phage baseplate assembly protein gpV